MTENSENVLTQKVSDMQFYKIMSILYTERVNNGKLYKNKSEEAIDISVTSNNKKKVWNI